MIKTILINGFPKSGKDTFIELCQENTTTRVHNFSTIDPLKNVLLSLGWDGTKSDEVRNFLFEFKERIEHMFQTSQKYIEKQLQWVKLIDSTSDRDQIVFIHCREPWQLTEFKKVFKSYNVSTLLVVRSDMNSSLLEDYVIAKYSYDKVINNFGTLEDLNEEAKKYMDLIGG